MHSEMAPGARLRALMKQGVVAAPGAFNGLVARAVAEAGFEAVYVSGGAVTAASGVPDVGLRTLDHFARVIREVADGSALPVVADADTGFGESEMVTRTVVEYALAGAAGLHIEDQVFPKRCGHLDGKALVPTEHFCEKVAAAATARDALAGAFVVCARTDAAGVEGLGAAVERSSAYVRAGADMIFPEGLTSENDFSAFAKAVRDLPGESPAGGPFLLANMTEFGKTPIIPLERFGELGYDLVIFPVTTLRVAMGAVTRALASLKGDGHAESFMDGMQSREELYRLLRYTPGQEWRFPASPTRDN